MKAKLDTIPWKRVGVFNGRSYSTTPPSEAFGFVIVFTTFLPSSLSVW